MVLSAIRTARRGFASSQYVHIVADFDFECRRFSAVGMDCCAGRVIDSEAVVASLNDTAAAPLCRGGVVEAILLWKNGIFLPRIS
jgi:hypothetical protein